MQDSTYVSLQHFGLWFLVFPRTNERNGVTSSPSPSPSFFFFWLGSLAYLYLVCNVMECNGMEWVSAQDYVPIHSSGCCRWSLLTN